MNIDVRLIPDFLVVAQELHFGRAAEELGIAQPALTQRIQRLEQSLDTPLFLRTSRTVSLTDAGALMAERFSPLMAQIQRELGDVARVGRGEEGSLDIGFVSTALPLGPSAQLESFRRGSPGVEIRIHEGFTAGLLLRVQRGEIDVATLRDPEPTARITARLLRSEPFVAVLPQEHPLARRSQLSGDDLATQDLVFFPERAGRLAFERNLQPITETGRVPRIVQEATTWGTVIDLVSAGLGITLCPESAAARAPEGVVVRPLIGTSARSEVMTVFREGEQRSVVRRYLDHEIAASPA